MGGAANDVEVDDKGLLTINSVSKQHEGLYQCLTENKFGRAIAAAIHVTMAGKF